MQKEKCEMNLSDYIDIIVRKKWLITAVTLACLIISVFFTSFQPKIHKAIRFLEPLPLVTYLPSLGVKLASLQKVSSIIEHHKLLLQSKTVLEKLLESLKSNSTINKNITLSEVAGKINVTMLKKEKRLRLSVEDTDPQKAKTIVNAWTEVYTQYNNDKLALSLYKIMLAQNEQKFVNNKLGLTKLKITLEMQQSYLKKLKKELADNPKRQYLEIIIANIQLETSKLRINISFKEAEQEKSLQESAELKKSLGQKLADLDIPPGYTATGTAGGDYFSEQIQKSNLNAIVLLDEFRLGGLRIIPSEVKSSSFLTSKKAAVAGAGFSGLILGIFLAVLVEIYQKSRPGKPL